jgi:hypothetical protein
MNGFLETGRWIQPMNPLCVQLLNDNGRTARVPFGDYERRHELSEP